MTSKTTKSATKSAHLSTKSASQKVTKNVADPNEVKKPDAKIAPPTKSEIAKSIADVSKHQLMDSKGKIGVSDQAMIMTGNDLKEYHRLQGIEHAARIRGLSNKTSKELVTEASANLFGGIKAAKRTLEQHIQAGLRITVLHNMHIEANGKTGWGNYCRDVLGISTSHAERLESCGMYGSNIPERDDKGEAWDKEPFLRWAKKGTSLTPKELAAHKTFVQENGLPETTPISKVTTKAAKKGANSKKAKGEGSGATSTESADDRDGRNMESIRERGLSLVNEYRTCFNSAPVTGDPDPVHVAALRETAIAIAKLMADFGISLAPVAEIAADQRADKAVMVEDRKAAAAAAATPVEVRRTRVTKAGRKVPVAA